MRTNGVIFTSTSVGIFLFCLKPSASLRVFEPVLWCMLGQAYHICCHCNGILRNFSHILNLFKKVFCVLDVRPTLFKNELKMIFWNLCNFSVGALQFHITGLPGISYNLLRNLGKRYNFPKLENFL